MDSLESAFPCLMNIFAKLHQRATFYFVLKNLFYFKTRHFSYPSPPPLSPTKTPFHSKDFIFLFIQILQSHHKKKIFSICHQRTNYFQQGLPYLVLFYQYLMECYCFHIIKIYTNSQLIICFIDLKTIVIGSKQTLEIHLTLSNE